jgi:hypothetical protein
MAIAPRHSTPKFVPVALPDPVQVCPRRSRIDACNSKGHLPRCSTVPVLVPCHVVELPAYAERLAA